MSLTLSDTRVYEPEIRARFGNHNTPILSIYRKSLLTLESFGTLWHEVVGHAGSSEGAHHLHQVQCSVFSVVCGLIPVKCGLIPVKCGLEWCVASVAAGARSRNREVRLWHEVVGHAGSSEGAHHLHKEDGEVVKT